MLLQVKGFCENLFDDDEVADWLEATDSEVHSGGTYLARGPAGSIFTTCLGGGKKIEFATPWARQVP